MTVLTLFAAIALALAIIGLYGVLANIVTSNQSAIGIRMALGASRSRIFTSLAMRGLRLSTLGCAIGLSVFLSIRRLMTPVLSGIGPVEPSVIGGACLLMLFVSLAACWFPARKATQIDPANVLHT